jgi:hypothetical protein
MFYKRNVIDFELKVCKFFFSLKKMKTFRQIFHLSLSHKNAKRRRHYHRNASALVRNSLQKYSERGV